MLKSHPTKQKQKQTNEKTKTKTNKRKQTKKQNKSKNKSEKKQEQKQKRERKQKQEQKQKQKQKQKKQKTKKPISLQCSRRRVYFCFEISWWQFRCGPLIANLCQMPCTITRALLRTVVCILDSCIVSTTVCYIITVARVYLRLFSMLLPLIGVTRSATTLIGCVSKGESVTINK